MKIIVLTLSVAILLLIGITKTFSQPLRINRNDNQRKLPVKRAFAGIRQVMELRRSVLMTVGPHEIRLPKGTIVDDAYQPRKVIFPEDFACTLTIGGQTITTPEGGVIRMNDTFLSTVQVSEATNTLRVGDNEVSFKNALGGEGITFYENGSVKCGYLSKDTELSVAGKRILFHKKSGINSAVWDHDSFEFGNIIFHPSGAVHKGYLKDTSALPSGAQTRVFLPGKTEWYGNGSVHKGIIAEPVHGSTAGAVFTVEVGEEVTFDSAGSPVIPEHIITLSSVTIPAFPRAVFHQAKVRLHQDTILIQEGELKAVTWIDLSVTLPDAAPEVWHIPFGPAKEEGNAISFYYKTFKPVYGYAGEDFAIRMRQQECIVQKGTFMRFYANGVPEEVVLARPVDIVIVDKRYRLEAGAEMKWFKNGDINQDVLLYGNLRKGLVRQIE